MNSALLMMAVALSQAFHCTTNAQTGFALNSETNSFTFIADPNPSKIDIKLLIEGDIAVVDWREESGRQLKGTQKFHNLPNGSTNGLNLVFSAVEGPCVQSKLSCGSLLNIVKKNDGAVAFTLVSTQAAMNTSTKAVWPVTGVLHGICPSLEINK